MSKQSVFSLFKSYLSRQAQYSKAYTNFECDAFLLLDKYVTRK